MQTKKTKHKKRNKKKELKNKDFNISLTPRFTSKKTNLEHLNSKEEQLKQIYNHFFILFQKFVKTVDEDDIGRKNHFLKN